MLSGFKTVRTIKKSPSAKTVMSNCPKCGKPVYFAERKVILGKDWHSGCLRCDNCDKTLTPGQHSAHLDKPYCNGCYQMLFGQEGFRKGVHQAKNSPATFPNQQSAAEKQEILSKISEYNLYKQTGVERIKSTEINGQILFEGVIKLYWGLKKSIKLAPGIMYAKQRNSRGSIYDFVSVDDAAYVMMLEEAQRVRAKRDLEESERKKLQMMTQGWDSKDTMPKDDPSLPDEDLMTMSLPSEGFYSSHDGPSSLPGTLERRVGRKDVKTSLEPMPEDSVDGNSVSLSHSYTRGSSFEGGSRNSSPRKRSASFRRISRKKKAEDRREMKHDFTPPYGHSTNLRVSNMVKTIDVLKMLLGKFKIENDVSEFALCIRYDNGIQELCKEDEFPLQLRLKLGPSEDIAKIFVIESSEAEENIPAEVGEWIKFSLTELELFNKKFEEEQERECKKIAAKFERWKELIVMALGREETDL